MAGFTLQSVEYSNGHILNFVSSVEYTFFNTTMSYTHIANDKAYNERYIVHNLRTK